MQVKAVSSGPMGRRAARAVWVLVALLAGVCPVAAQDQQEPEPNPLGPLTTDQDRPAQTGTVQTKRLDLGLSLFDAADNTTVTDARRVFTAEPLLEDRYNFTGGGASLTYSYTGKENNFGAAGGTGLRYYNATSNAFYPNDFYGGVTFTRRLNRRVVMRGGETLTMSPYYTFGNSPLSGDLSHLIAPQFDHAVNRVDAVTSNTTAGTTIALGRRSSLSAGYTFDYVDASATYNVQTMGANASYQYQKTRYLSIRAGYGFYRSQLFGQAVPYYDSHNIDAGIGYRKPLSFSRRSVLGFNVGSTIVTDGTYKSFWVTGDASLTHQLSQFWALVFSYNRNVSRLGGLADPYVNDLGAVSIAGLLTKKLTLAGSGSFSRGNTANGPSRNAYDAMYVSGRLGYPLTRFLPVYGEYVYYLYQFDSSTGLAVNFPMNVKRYGLRAGLSYSIPLIGRRPARR
jgi:hypothetical protein